MKFSVGIVRSFCVVCLICLKGTTQAEPAVAKFREVILKVVDEAGRPLAGVPVAVIGTARFTRGGDDPWRFISDARGQCTVRFGCFRDLDYPAGAEMPGWGEYYCVAESRGLRGVSICVEHDEKGQQGTDDSDLIDDTDEWLKRGMVWTSAKPLRVLLRMKRGVRVQGRVVDHRGHPISGFEFSIYQDLHFNSHTGYGGAIFRQTATSDPRGHFSFEGVYPNTFYPDVRVDERHLPVWVRTRLRGRWIAQPVWSISPHRSERVVQLTLEVTRTLPYCFRGVVVDWRGKPVAGAQILFGVSQHEPMKSYGDFHRSLQGESDENGRFEIHLASPFVRFVSVTAAGFSPYNVDFYDDVESLRDHRRWKFVMPP